MTETKQKDEISSEIVRLSLQPYKDQVLEAQAILFGERPIVLYSIVALFDVVLIIGYIYDMGFFAFVSLCLLIAYLLAALYFKFKNMLQNQIFPDRKGISEAQQNESFNQICAYIANLQNTFTIVFSYLFEGKIGIGITRVAITAAIWFAIILILNYFGSFWFVFIIANVILLAPSTLRLINKKQNSEAPQQVYTESEPANPPSAPSEPSEEGKVDEE